MTKKIWELPELAAITDDDIFLVANDPGGAPTTRYITAANLGYASKAAANVFTVAPQQVTINSAGNKGFIIKAANSQSANLQEWQDSSGTVLAYIDANGYVHSPILRSPTSMMLYTPLDITLNGSQVRITTDGDAATPAVGWDNDRDTGLFRQGANSLGIAAGGVEVFRVVAGASAATGLSVTGNAAGSGVTLTALSSGSNESIKLMPKGTGVVQVGDNSTPGRVNLYATGNLGFVGSDPSNFGVVISGSSLPLLWVTAVDARLRADGFLSWSGDTSTAVSGRDTALARNAAAVVEVNTGTAGQWAALRCGAPAAGTIGLIVKGAVSQTANLQEWQNSSGAILLRVNSSGGLAFHEAAAGVLVGTLTGDVATGGIRLDVAAAGYPGLVIRAAASQTANLQEWQNSSGTVLAYVSSAGYVKGTRIEVGSIGAYWDGNNIYPDAGNPMYVNGFAIQAGGAAFKSAYINSSTGTPLGTSGWYGTLANNVNATYRSQVALHVYDYGADYSAGREAMRIVAQGTAAYVGIGETTPLAMLHVKNTNASDIGVIVKGALSQTANLQEWQNSSGTVLAWVENDGELYTPKCKTLSVDPGLTNGLTVGSGWGVNLLASALDSYYVTVTGNLRAVCQHASAVPFYVQGAASQTGNMIELRNSSGAVLATYSENGYCTTRKNSAPADAELAAGEAAYWFDSTNGAGKFMVKAKTADGTVVTGSISLA